MLNLLVSIIYIILNYEVYSEVEKQMNQILEEHAAYHLERSTILSKLLSCGEISDYS